MLDFSDEFSSEACSGERVAFTTRVVVEELFTNLLRHDRGGKGDIEVAIEKTPDALILTLRDFDVEEPDMREIERRRATTTRGDRERAALPGDAVQAHQRPGGLGVRIVETLSDRLTYEYSERTLMVTARIDMEQIDVRHKT